MGFGHAILSPVIGMLISLINIYEIILFIRIIMSWVNPDPYNPIVRFIASITDPLLFWFSTRFRLRFGMIDFSPMILFLALEILKGVLRWLAISVM